MQEKTDCIFIWKREMKKEEGGTQTVMKHAIPFVSSFSSYLLDFILSYVHYRQGRNQLYHFAILTIPWNIHHVSYWKDVKSFPYSIPIHDSYITCYAVWKSLNILHPFLLMYSECVKTSIKVTIKFKFLSKSKNRMEICWMHILNYQGINEDIIF